MTLFQALLLLAAFLCSLVAGLLFTFAIVVMPGIAKLDDRDFVRTFQVIDGVIQNNQPAFLFVWIGSALSLMAAGVLGIWKLGGADRLLLLASAIVYVIGVQVPTATVNVPLNNELQRLDPGTMSEADGKRARRTFEPRWNRWNGIRTVCASVASLLLLVLLFRV